MVYLCIHAMSSYYHIEIVNCVKVHSIVWSWRCINFRTRIVERLKSYSLCDLPIPSLLRSYFKEQQRQLIRFSSHSYHYFFPSKISSFWMLILIDRYQQMNQTIHPIPLCVVERLPKIIVLFVFVCCKILYSTAAKFFSYVFKEFPTQI